MIPNFLSFKLRTTYTALNTSMKIFSCGCAMKNMEKLTIIFPGFLSIKINSNPIEIVCSIKINPSVFMRVVYPFYKMHEPGMFYPIICLYSIICH